MEKGSAQAQGHIAKKFNTAPPFREDFWANELSVHHGEARAQLWVENPIKEGFRFAAS